MGFLNIFKSSSKKKSNPSSNASISDEEASTAVPSSAGSKSVTTSAVETMNELQETAAILELKEKKLEKEMAELTQKAKSLAATNQNAALLALKKKKALEQQYKTIQNNRIRIEEEKFRIEISMSNIETVKGMKAAAKVHAALFKEVTPEEIEDTMEDLNEFKEMQQQIEESLNSFQNQENVDELNEELEMLAAEAMADKLSALSTAKIPAVKSKVPAYTTEEARMLSDLSTDASDNEELLEAHPSFTSKSAVKKKTVTSQDEDEDIRELQKLLAL